jgi:hypothetical protein
VFVTKDVLQQYQKILHILYKYPSLYNKKGENWTIGLPGFILIEKTTAYILNKQFRLKSLKRFF